MAAHQGVIEQSYGRHAHPGRLLPAHFFSNVYRSVSSSPGLPFLLTQGTIQEGAEQVAQDMQHLATLDIMPYKG